MFLHARGVIKRRLEAAKAEASKAGAAIDGAADQVGAAAVTAKRTIAERARDEFLAAYDRFQASMHALEADSEGAADKVVQGIAVPFADVAAALSKAHGDLAADAAGARSEEHAEDQAARDQVDPASRL